jgi:hypothetical protein
MKLFVLANIVSHAFENIKNRKMISSRFGRCFFSIFICLAGATANAAAYIEVEEQATIGEWLIDTNNQTMLDPQSSGLKYASGYLYSLSDGSADKSQQKRLHKLAVDSAKVLHKYGPTRFSENVKRSCFFGYLAGAPDYEGMAALNVQGTQWVFVTEDARNGVQLSPACQAKYANTHSTVYPTLLVRLTLKGDDLVVDAVRPVQFPKEANVGDASNDGIEGLAITKRNELLLGLEKDANNQARVFKTQLSESFWDDQSFVSVVDADLLLPTFESGRHPINGMDVYYPDANSEGFLIAAARNDDKLWIIDLAAKKPTVKVPLIFIAPSLASDSEQYCAPLHEMDNASIEGVAVMNHELVLVNDPWKVNYQKNVVCKADSQRYEMFSPLIFRVSLKPEWFK